MTFEFTYGNTHTTMDLGTLILLILLSAAYLWFTYWLLSRGIRTLCGKPLNNPPSPIFWAKVTADIVEEDTEEVWHGIPEAFQASHKAKKGTANLNHDGYMRRFQICKVAYTYREEYYTSIVQDCVIRDGKTTIYCYKLKPQLTKVYKPERSWSKASGISMLLAAAFLILMAVLLYCGLFA